LPGTEFGRLDSIRLDDLPMTSERARPPIDFCRTYSSGAALEATIPLDPDQRDTYHDILMAWLPEALREELMMTAKSLYPQSDFAREHFGKGRVEALAAVLRRQLTLRFGPIPEALEQRLQAADADTLLRWAERILTATTPDEVFDG
jgi:hypothetical protein